jgi:hypothetical protein
VKLSDPQVELLTDIATKPQMYITCYSKWDRTAHALVSRGLAFKSDNGYPQYELKITVDGQSEAVRRGILKAEVTP